MEMSFNGNGSCRVLVYLRIPSLAVAGLGVVQASRGDPTNPSHSLLGPAGGAEGKSVFWSHSVSVLSAETAHEGVHSDIDTCLLATLCRPNSHHIVTNVIANLTSWVSLTCWHARCSTHPFCHCGVFVQFMTSGDFWEFGNWCRLFFTSPVLSFVP